MLIEESIKEKTKSHELWLRGEREGQCLTLTGRDLSGTSLQKLCLQEVNFKNSILKNVDFQDSDMQRTVLSEVDAQNSNFCGVDFFGTDFQRADFRGVNMDHSCWPLWCGSFDVKVDKRIAAQLAYHFCRLDCNDPEYIRARNMLIDFANQFHMAKDCGILIRMEADGA